MSDIEIRKTRPQQFWYPAGTMFEFHPAANEYPLLEADELELLTQDMKDNGFDPHFPIILLGDKILDGRNRFQAARLAGIEFLTATVAPDTDPQEYVERANEHRRHLTSAWLRQKRAERIKRVAQARAEGQSTRTIAEQEGISQPQVLRDLQASGDTGVSPEPEGEKVAGRDGKTYPASRPKPAEREPGDDTDSEQAEKARPRNGQALFDWRAFHSALGQLTRSVDSLGNAYGIHRQDTLEKQGMFRLLEQFHKDFRTWFKTLSGETAPRG